MCSIFFLSQQNSGNFFEMFVKNQQKFQQILPKILRLEKTVHRSALCRSRRELSKPDSYSKEYLLAKFGFDTNENELSKVCRSNQAIPTPGHKSGSEDGTKSRPPAAKSHPDPPPAGRRPLKISAKLLFYTGCLGERRLRVRSWGSTKMHFFQASQCQPSRAILKIRFKIRW